MNEPKFTPGPWKVHLEESYFVTGPDLGRVAIMTHLKGKHGMLGRRSADESAANARLIAAAPDLYEALRGAFDLMSAMRAVASDRIDISQDSRWLNVRVALAAVTGETE